MAAIGGGQATCAFGTQSSTEVNFLRYAHKLGRSNLEYSSAASRANEKGGSRRESSAGFCWRFAMQFGAWMLSSVRNCAIAT